MTLLLTLGLLSTVHAAPDPSCPDDATVRALKRQNSALEQALSVPQPNADVLDGAFVEVQTLLGCVDDPPPSVVGRSFLLLGGYYLDQGDAFRAEPFVGAAALLGGQSAWLEALGPDLRTRFFNALVTDRPVGVVYAPELLLTGGIHLVGSLGPPPWLMPVGTFTFEWNDRSVPVSVNDHELTLVVPQTFNEFEALVEGVTESDLLEPDYDTTIYYDRRESRRNRKQDPQPPPEPQPDPEQPADPPPPDEPSVDASSFFDELAELDTDDGTPATTPEPQPKPPREGAGLSVRPHLGAGGAWTITGAASAASPVGDESFGGLGLLAELGLTLRLGRYLALRPELGFRSAGNAPQLDPSLFADEGYDGEVPVEPMRNRLLLGQARLPVLLALGPVSIGAGPAWAMGTARVTALTSCGEDSSCVAPMQGSVMAAGGSMLLGIRPGSSPVMPWLDLTVLHDGERTTMAGGLVLAWEGSP